MEHVGISVHVRNSVLVLVFTSGSVCFYQCYHVLVLVFTSGSGCLYHVLVLVFTSGSGCLCQLNTACPYQC